MPSLNTGNAILSNPIKVDSSYNVGIGGAASGSYKLQVTGTTNLTGALTGTSASFSSTLGVTGAATFSSSVTSGNISIGAGGTEYPNGQLLFTNTTSGSYVGIGTQMPGAATMYFDHRATSNTGSFAFRNGSGGANALMTIAAGGNVGIGTSSPSVRLNTFLNDNLDTIQIRAESNTSSVVSYTGLGAAFLEYYRGVATGVDLTIQTKIDAAGSGGNIVFAPNSSSVSYTPVERMRITKAGNVGIGTNSPVNYGTTNLDVNAGSGSAAYIVARASNNGETIELAMDGGSGYLSTKSAHPLRIRTSDVTRIVVNTDGRVWINTAISGFEGSSATLQINGFTRTSGQMIFHNPANVAQSVSVSCNGADTFRVEGVLSKASGSFRIDHPLESMANTHELVHSFVEAPQADLYYRGKLSLVNGKAQANIDEVSTMTEGTFEALCKEVQCFTTNETGWDLVKGKVLGNIIYIESQNSNSTDEISWLVIGERKDKHMMDTSWTDENGRVIVEPLKPNSKTR